MTAQQYRAAAIGKRSRTAGAVWEDIIGASCAYYRANGMANIEKTPEAMKPIGPKDSKGHFIIWNKQTGQLVGGHQRLTVLLDMGKTEAEVVVVDLPQHEEKQLNLLLNRAKGRWDNDKLADLLAELDKAGGIDLTGFDEWELQGLIDSYDDQLGDILDSSHAYDEESGSSRSSAGGGGATDHKRDNTTEPHSGPDTFDIDFSIPDAEQDTINDYLQEEENALDYLAEAVVQLAKGMIDDED